jgi:CRP-like cAMP-binding protein
MSSPSDNRLLAALSPQALKLLTPHCSPVDLPVRTSLYEPEQAPRYAFFMTSGMASVVTPMLDGGTAEVEVIGHEGLAGSLHLLGSAPVNTSCFMQLSGTALRIGLPELRAAFQASAEIRGRILELIQHQALSVSQIAGCNRLHEAEARLSRWLLMAQDRTQSDVLQLTQEFLAEMLGTQRTTVTTVAGVLQRSGLIEYRQGVVKIKDRESLQAAACDCYRIVRQLYTNLYSKPVA